MPVADARPRGALGNGTARTGSGRESGCRREEGSGETCGAFALWETVLGALRPPRAVFHGAKAPPLFPRRTRLTGALGNGRRETAAIRRPHREKGRRRTAERERLAKRKGSKTPRNETARPSRGGSRIAPARNTERTKLHPENGAHHERRERTAAVVGNRVRGFPYAPCGFPWRRLRAPLPEARPGSGRPRGGREAKGSKALHGNRSPMGNRDRVGGVKRRRRRTPDALRARRAEGLPRAGRSPDDSLISATGAMRPRCLEIRSRENSARQDAQDRPT